MNKEYSHKKNKVRLSGDDKFFYGLAYGIIAVLTLLVLYPIIYVISASFSSGEALIKGKVWLFPVDLSLEGYKSTFEYKNIWLGYRNTIFYTAVGTIINLAVTLSCAYPLARKNLRGGRFFTLFFSFTMIFSGGMIPSYILVKNLGLLDTIWAMLLPGAMSVYNMVVARTFIQTNIPDELREATRIDGCDDIQFFFKMLLPLSKAIIAVLALWYAVGHWNSYFNAFLYLTNKNLYPLQIFLKEILVQSQYTADMAAEAMLDQENYYYIRLIIKYSIIVVSTAPLFAAYPFVQKYFVKGVMIGSLKG